MIVLLSVIIVSYQNYDILKDCLNSIEKFNDIGDELEVIVSDNSTDYKLFDSLKVEFPWVKAIKNDNVGFGKGNNIGVRKSTGEYLLFLNPDTILIEPIFDFAIKTFEQNSQIGLFGIKLFTKELKPNHSYYMMDYYSIHTTILSKVLFNSDFFIDGKMYIAGADLFVRRVSFVEARMFDEKIFMCYEEPDLIRRIRKLPNHNKTAYFKQKRMIHLESGTEEKNADTYVLQVGRSMDTYMYYCDKWGIPFEKNVRDMCRYQRLKRFLCLLRGKRSVVKMIDKLLKQYDGYINSYRQRG